LNENLQRIENMQKYINVRHHPPAPSSLRRGETRSVRGGRKVLSPCTVSFVLPSAFVVDPLIVSSLPSAFYPNSMRPRRTHPPTGNPSVAMMSRVPFVITGNPHRIARRSNNHPLLPRGGRTDVDSNSDMELCGSRNGDRHQSTEQCKLQKCFHRCMRLLC
jgi:hypothetical protein